VLSRVARSSSTAFNRWRSSDASWASRARSASSAGRVSICGPQTLTCPANSSRSLRARLKRTRHSSASRRAASRASSARSARSSASVGIGTGAGSGPVLRAGIGARGPVGRGGGSFSRAGGVAVPRWASRSSAKLTRSSSGGGPPLAGTPGPRAGGLAGRRLGAAFEGAGAPRESALRAACTTSARMVSARRTFG
jgi:hypothetical protein